MNLQETIKNIDFQKIKETGKSITVKIKNSKWLNKIEFEYFDAPTIYDKEGFTYCLNLKSMPFHSWPMRDANYIQTYKSIKRMLNSLYKKVSKDIEVQLG